MQNKVATVVFSTILSFMVLLVTTGGCCEGAALAEIREVSEPKAAIVSKVVVLMAAAKAFSAVREGIPASVRSIFRDQLIAGNYQLCIDLLNTVFVLPDEKRVTLASYAEACRNDTSLEEGRQARSIILGYLNRLLKEVCEKGVEAKHSFVLPIDLIECFMKS